ncbi:MAG: iron-containing alcohol dehydrogenase family protein [Promethearchaeota archaeon]
MNDLDSVINFNFRTPRIIFKKNSWKNIPNECAEFGNEGIIVLSNSVKNKSGVYSKLIKELKNAGLRFDEHVKEKGEPTVDAVDMLANKAKNKQVDWILGIGGGSTIDLAKAAAGLAKNEGIASVYQEGRSLKHQGIPFIAVPTTAGTGAEVTNNSVLIDRKRGIKKSIRGDKMLPKVAILDPILTMSMPPSVTAFSGLDALTQAIEAYVSKASNAISDILAEKAMKVIWENLENAWKDGNNFQAREKMLFGSLLSALSFSNAKLGAVHGFAHPIGVKHGLPHGLICGVLLPHVMSFNLEGNLPEVTEKFARIFTFFHPELEVNDEPEKKVAKKAIKEISNLLMRINVPRTLSDLGIKKGDISLIVADTKGSSLANNPRDTNPHSLTQILLGAL